MSFEPNGGHDKPNDKQLKLYEMLVDQLQKHTTIFWQFPVALLAANVFAVDKFLLQQPKLLLSLFLMDFALVYTFHWEILHQRAVISATQSAERLLRSTDYYTFIPQFGEKYIKIYKLLLKVPKGSNVIIWGLWLLTVFVLLLSLWSQSKQYAEVSAVKSLYEYADLLKAQKRGDGADVRAKADKLWEAKTRGSMYLSFVSSDELKEYANLLEELHRATEADAVRALARAYQYTQEADVCSGFLLVLYWLKTWVD